MSHDQDHTRGGAQSHYAHYPSTNALRPQSHFTSHTQGHAGPEVEVNRNQHTTMQHQIGAGQPRARPPSPRIPNQQSSTALPMYYDRTLPSRNVTANTITDAFVAFILYCNPNFPSDVDTATLRTNFENPPKSDSKDFETFRLYELIQKFDSKEIKTWNQLALDLGVEAPDPSKGQSVQKVQQYSVRLKRWMRAMHIDAFFEYLLGKQHSYFTDLPTPNDPYPATGRDGVAAEEDLAIRALDPSFRPKRGRRRNSDVEQEEAAESARSNKQLKAGDPYSAIPSSAINHDVANDPWALASAILPNSAAPWSSRSSAIPSNIRWQASQTPATPHPMSSLTTSMSAHIDAAFDGEPRSAVTPSTRKRRRHGPAVSSAWPSTNTPGAKPRGRPPASRNVQDGPFGTFPVDAANDRSPAVAHLPTPLTADKQVSFEPPLSTPPVTSAISEGGRRSRLSLQVPPHTGGPIRLATPPRVLVNGETNDSESRSDSDAPILATQRLHSSTFPSTTTTTPLPSSDAAKFAFPYESLKRHLASDLLRADLVGRRTRLSGEEAKRLAGTVLERIGVPTASTSSSSLADDIARLNAASWLGIANHLSIPTGGAMGHAKRITVTRFRLDAEGYEQIAPIDTRDAREVEGEDGGGEGGREESGVREVFDLAWQVSLGSCMGTFELKTLTLAPLEPEEEDLHDLMSRKCMEAINMVQREDGWLEDSLRRFARAGRGKVGDDGVDWKGKCMAMEFASRVVRGELGRLKDRMLDQVMEALL